MPETISRPFTFVKGEVFYFSRRVPKELRDHYTSSRIAYSLRTKSPQIAEVRARRAADQLDEYWYHRRCQSTEIPGKHMLRMKLTGRTDVIDVPSASSFVLLSEAAQIYLQLKGNGRPVTFHRAAERVCGYVIDACGDKHL